MRRIVTIALAVASFTGGAALAQKSVSQLQTENQSTFPTGCTNCITPNAVSTLINDIILSYQNIGGVGSGVFGASGPSHSIGLVPDPGVVAGSTRFLREDATWGSVAATPGGSSGQLQFNSASSFAGVPGSAVSTNGSLTLGATTVTVNDPILNLSQTWNTPAIATTGASGTGATATITFAPQPVAFPVGSSVNVSGVSPIGYNGNGIIITGSTTSSISYTNGTTGAQTQAGTVLQNVYGAVINITDPNGLQGSDELFELRAAGTPVFNVDYNGNLATLNNGHIQGNLFVIGNSSASTYINPGNTVAVSTPVLNLLQTWNAVGVTFTGIKLNITNTSSAANSLLMDLQVNSGSEFNVDRSGNVTGAGTVQGNVNVIALGNLQATSGNLQLASNSGIIAMGSGFDLRFTRATPGVVQIGDSSGGTNNGFINYAGQARVTADAPTVNTTLTNVTGLAVSLTTGRTYGFDTYLNVTDAGAGGVQAAITGSNGLSATAIEYDGWIVENNAIKGQQTATALGTVTASSITTNTSGIVIQIKGTITVNVGGTLNVQAAQAVNNATSTIIKRGSRMYVQDMP